MMAEKKMTLNFPLSSFIFLLVLVLIPIKGNNCGPIRYAADDDLIGSSEPITNLKDPEVLMAAKFAVTKHNKQAKTSLIYVTLIKGQSQLVSSMLYELVISAKDGSAGKPKLYRAQVWDRVWMKNPRLILDSFKEM
ncbi:hypothetical protein CASFOL_027248 [Castilleja foliolosa]|uniref:Cystatin domain-containing protein n=1 Tax=Castilleja foliolosa TaxID=1961234 RepID=A0ABD3CHP9_9LAMI